MIGIDQRPEIYDSSLSRVYLYADNTTITMQNASVGIVEKSLWCHL